MTTHRLKKKILAALLFAGLAFMCGAQERIQLKIASPAPARSPWDIQLRELAQEWSEITNGQVTITYYDATSLGGEKSVLQRLKPPRPGQRPPLDGAVLSSVGLNEMAPAAKIYTLSIPFLIQSQAELDAALDAYGDGLISEFNKQGFRVIAWTNVGWLSFYTQEPFSNLAELSRIKLASAGLDSPTIGEVFRAAGLSVEDVQGAKVLQSLRSSGGVHGFYAVHMYAYVAGYYKGINYAFNSKMCPVMAGLVISNSAWERIPNQYKSALLASVERVKQRLNDSLDESDARYVAMMESEGVKMINPTPAEITAWQRDFNKAVEAVNARVPDAFDMTLYRNIQSLLRKN